jgi:hypothetical protein
MENQPSDDALRKRRQDKLGKLGLCGPFVVGSLNRVEKRDKEGRAKVHFLLTFKEAGRTRSVYVPKDLAKEVRQWVRNYQKLKKAIALVSRDSIALIRGHVPARRAAGARRRGRTRNP